ncbi:hypothetical protein [Leptospira biflexa]|nr:hypothetical protein [Leptospira biflexa]
MRFSNHQCLKTITDIGETILCTCNELAEVYEVRRIKVKSNLQNF